MNKVSLFDSHPDLQRYVFLTGATGLVGRYLMRDLLLKGCHLAVVVRPSKRMDVHQRIEAILQYWERELGMRLPRPIVFEGDVRQPNLGLRADEILWIRKHCDRMIHSAALLQFERTAANDEPWCTNFGGTRNAVNLARLANIAEFHYLSTAYVCGKRETPVFEDELECGQDFRNEYERSKYEAEKLVTGAKHFDSTTIYRPAVIVGDSKTGFTSAYHGLYLYLRLLCTLVPQQKRNERGVIETPIRLPMNGDEPRNLVPVDWVSRVVSHIFCTPAAHGRTFHLAPNKCVTPREIIDYCYTYFNSCGVEFCGSNATRTGDSDFAKRFFENVSIYESYETSDPHFELHNLEKFAGQFECPKIDQEMILRFIEFGQANRWGKRREVVPDVERCFDSQLTYVAKSASRVLGRIETAGGGPLVRFGLDIRGPGGGQWQMTATSGGEFEVTAGLPDDSCPILVMDDNQVNRLLAETQTPNAFTSENRCPISIWSNPIESMLATVISR